MNMPKTIYLHIGMHKTGSSTIQEELYQYRDQLEARGYVYPCLLGENEVAHHNIVWELKENGQFDPTLCKLAELQAFIEQTHYDNIIISTEHFSKASVKDLRKFTTYLKGYQVKVIVYFRRQDQLMQSTWSQNVKTGIVTLTFEEWFNSIVFNEPLPEDRASEQLRKHMPELANRIKYDTFITKYSSVFGEENIMVRAYERPYMNSNIVADFLQFIGMDDVAWIPETPNHNISPSIKTLEFLRQMALGWYSKTQDYNFTKTIQSHLYFSQLEKIADDLGWNAQRLNLIDQRRYDLMMGIYGEGNKTVAQTYLGRDDLFRDPFVDHPVTTFDVDEYTTDELMAMAQEMAVKSLHLLKIQTETTIKPSQHSLLRRLRPITRLLKRS